MTETEIKGFYFTLGFVIGILIIIFLSATFQMNGFHFGEKTFPIAELKNGTLVECIVCSPVQK